MADRSLDGRPGQEFGQTSSRLTERLAYQSCEAAVLPRQTRVCLLRGFFGARVHIDELVEVRLGSLDDLQAPIVNVSALFGNSKGVDCLGADSAS